MIGIRPISTYLINVQSRQYVADTQKRLQQASQELATGLVADAYESLGMSSAHSISLRSLLSQTEDFVTQNKVLMTKLDSQAEALVKVREAAQQALDLAIQSVLERTTTTRTIQNEARAAIDRMVQALNVNLAGDFLFAGIHSDRVPVVQANGDIPLSDENEPIRSPLGVVTGIIGNLVSEAKQTPANEAEARAVGDALKAFFASENSDGDNYEGTLYQGSVGAARRSARIDHNQTLEYGIQANDQAFTEIFRGLYMLASINVADIENGDAYKAYMEEAVGAVSGGIFQLQDAESRLGSQQQLLQQVQRRQEDQAVILNNRVVAMEHVDPYDAQVRMTLLETQLQATYNVSARLGQMSFVHWMR